MKPDIKFPDIDLSKVKAVLLDLDNTLFHYDSCNAKAISKCHAHYQKHIDKKISLKDFSDFYYKKRNLTIKRLSPQGACRSRLFVFQAMFEEMKFDESWVLAAKYDQIYWQSLIANMKIAKDAENFLKKCKKANIATCIVTDMIADIQVLKLQKLQVTKYIKYLVTSEEVGAEKPDAAMFKTALKKLKLTAKDVIMIGDDYDKDIKGAKAVGIKSYQVKVIG